MPIEDMAAYKREWRAKRRAAGVCTTCGGAVDTGGARCSTCRTADNAGYQRRGKARYQARAVRVNDTARESRRLWKSEGRCTLCGGKRDRPNRCRCLGCRAAHRRRLPRRKAEWQAKGLCTRCGAARDARLKTCMGCLKRERANYSRAMARDPGAFVARQHKRLALLKGNGGHFTPEEWEAIKAAQGYRCLMCRLREPEIKLTVDHVIPVTSGGPSFAWNIQGLCQSCNKSKGTKTLDLTCPPGAS